jgi:hypothetical protein
MSAGKRTGVWTLWWENGQKKAEGACVGGEEEGSWTFWSDDGQIDASKSGSYHAGQLASANGQSAPPTSQDKAAEEKPPADRSPATNSSSPPKGGR